MNEEAPDPRVLACYAAAKAKARELGRWDADHAIFDLLAAELPRELHGVIAWYLATEQWGNYLAGLHALGYSRRDELVGWGYDVLSELGSWCTWDLGEGLKYGLSSFERWVPPVDPKAARAAEPTPADLRFAYASECPPAHGAIRVYTNEEIPAGMHWATAAGQGIINHVATYFAPLVDAFVCRAHVAEVERLHPRKSYIYL